MVAEWKSLTVGDAFELVNGFAFKSKDFIEEGIPVIKIKNVKAGYFSEHEFSYVDSGFLQTKSDKLARIDDLLVSMSGNRHDGSPDTWVGKVALFRKKTPYLINQRVGALRSRDTSIYDPRFMSYLLSSWKYQSLFISVATSSGGQANLSPGQILGAPIDVPAIGTQIAIANILGSLDDKIELNRQMNETLEAMAQALFKSWFVDFDPVIDNALAAGNEIPEPLQARAAARQALGDQRKPLPPEIQSQFPSSFVFTDEMGWIPEGWNTEPLGNHLYIKGRIGWKGLKRSEYSPEKTGYFIVNGSDFTDEQIDWSKGGWITQDRYDESPEIQLQEGDILITKDGTIGKLAFVDKLIFKTSVASGIFVVRTSDELLTTLFCWMFFKSPYFRTVVESKIDGSVIPHLYQRDFVEVFIPLPAANLLQRFDEQLSAIFNKIFRNKNEINTLSHLRDTLLPKLLSGEIRVSEAEQPVTEAL